MLTYFRDELLRRNGWSLLGFTSFIVFDYPRMSPVRIGDLVHVYYKTEGPEFGSLKLYPKCPTPFHFRFQNEILLPFGPAVATNPADPLIAHLTS
jgi:hypothetical protein